MTPTPEQVEAWAREAGLASTSDYYSQPGIYGLLNEEADLTEELTKFAALACAWQRERDASLRNVAAQVLRDMQAQGVLIEWQTMLDEAIRSDCAEPGKAG